MRPRATSAALVLAVLALATFGLRGRAATRSAAAERPVAAGEDHRFKCGNLRCDARERYCETINTDVAELPSNYACRSLPATCRPVAGREPADCRCFPRGTRGDFCGVTRAGKLPGFYRTTVGGH